MRLSGEGTKAGTQRTRFLYAIRPCDEWRACPDTIGAACAGMTRVSKQAVTE